MKMNEDWLTGKHPVLGEALEKSRQVVDKDGTNSGVSAADRVADCCSGWGLYWAAVLFLTCAVSDAFFVLGFFGGIAKWICQRNKNAVQAQTDKLYGKTQGENDSLSDRVRDWETDTLNNPLYMGFPGNVANIDHDNFPEHQC
jgi:hypothetical protein